MNGKVIELVPLRELVYPTSRERAVSDLKWYADCLRSMTTVLRPVQYSVALNWVTDWRMYCFERNPSRWPDGLFYLVDRGYQLWRGHRISLSDGELRDVYGLDAWTRPRLHGRYDPQRFVPLQSDHYNPRRNLRRFVEIAKALADSADAATWPS